MTQSAELLEILVSCNNISSSVLWLWPNFGVEHFYTSCASKNTFEFKRAELFRPFQMHRPREYRVYLLEIWQTALGWVGCSYIDHLIHILVNNSMKRTSLGMFPGISTSSSLLGPLSAHMPKGKATHLVSTWLGGQRRLVSWAHGMELPLHIHTARLRTFFGTCHELMDS